MTFFAPVTEIAAGGKHLARDRKGQTHSWGCGNGGALGTGDTESVDFALTLPRYQELHLYESLS